MFCLIVDREPGTKVVVFTSVISLLHAVVNPPLYGWMSQRYRRGYVFVFKMALSVCGGNRPNRRSLSKFLFTHLTWWKANETCLERERSRDLYQAAITNLSYADTLALSHSRPQSPEFFLWAGNEEGLRFSDHVTKRNGGPGNENGVDACHGKCIIWVTSDRRCSSRSQNSSYFTLSGIDFENQVLYLW